jgi:hypothetical protein
MCLLISSPLSHFHMGVHTTLKGALTDLYHQSSSYLAKVLRRVLHPRRTEMELKKKKKKKAGEASRAVSR